MKKKGRRWRWVTDLTNVLETNSTRGVVKVHTADLQRVQLCYMMPSNLQPGKTQFRLCVSEVKCHVCSSEVCWSPQCTSVHYHFSVLFPGWVYFLIMLIYSLSIYHTVHVYLRTYTQMACVHTVYHCLNLLITWLEHLILVQISNSHNSSLELVETCDFLSYSWCLLK